MTATLAVVDAAQVIRAGIQKIVSTTDAIILVGAWEAVEPFWEFMEEGGEVEVLLLGDNLNQTSLKQLTAYVVKQQPKLKVILLAARFTPGLIEELAKLGAMGFMCKDEALGDFFVGAVHAVKRGDVYISPQTARTLFLAGSGQPHVGLSPRQLQVLQYMSHYISPQEIAQKMNTSVSSIYNLPYRLRIALGVNNTGEILIEAAKRGLVAEREQV